MRRKFLQFDGALEFLLVESVLHFLELFERDGLPGFRFSTKEPSGLISNSSGSGLERSVAGVIPACKVCLPRSQSLITLLAWQASPSAISTWR